MPRDGTETYEKILPAAKEEFLEKGFEQASMREIASRAGISAAGIYRHFKGNLYKVIALATHSEEEKPYVIYRQMYGDFALWVRPLDMFLETIERDGMRFKRFQFLFRQNEADQLTK